MLTTDLAPLFRRLRGRGAGDEAEDIMQDLWLKTSRIQSNAIVEPCAFLFTVADNLARDHLRAVRRRAARERHWSELAFDWSGRDETPSAERVIAARQRLRLVEAALCTLDAKAQAIFRRFRIDGASQAEVARELGISVSAVQKHLYRAYRLLDAFAHEEDAFEPARALTS